MRTFNLLLDRPAWYKIKYRDVIEQERSWILAGLDMLLSEDGELRFHTSPAEGTNEES